MKFSVVFYVAYPYYFPHFLPISRELERRGYRVFYVLSSKQNSSLMEKIAKDNSLQYIFGEENLLLEDADFIFFAKSYDKLKELKGKTIFLEHGVGTKSTGFYHLIEDFDIYLVEGDYKYQRLLDLYPQHEAKLQMVGFSKFDDIINMNKDEKISLYKKYNLDSEKKTILYAPTFFPSSIEKMSDNFPLDFKEYNIIIKAHYMTYERKRYKNQRKKLSHWNSFENCTVVDVHEYNLVPFFAISDVMISDESSAMFEFASLNKPVISNRYFKLRLSYYLMPWRLKRRIDIKRDKHRKILDNANSYEETLQMTKDALLNPLKLEKLRLKFSKEICGSIDGKVSSRIVDMLESKYE